MDQVGKNSVVSQHVFVDNVSNDMVHNMLLPPCNVDVVEGNFISWSTFRDFFTAAYVNNSRLSDIDKLCCFVRKTSGEQEK